MQKTERQKKVESIRKKYHCLERHLNERSRRLWAATEAVALGEGGKTIVYMATKLDYKTIKRGVLEISMKPEESLPTNCIREEGGGRKRKMETNKSLGTALLDLIEPSVMGNPQNPLRWISKSTRKISAELHLQGKELSHTLISRELLNMGYSLQTNKKTMDGGTHPDRDAQFHFINEKVKDFQAENEPVVSVDTKKKENIGNFKNNGRDYFKKGASPKINVHDFLDKEKGKVAPFGVYDLAKNKGWVSVGISHDTAAFAVNSIRTWWNEMGKETYPKATKLYINADGGGSNASKSRLWKCELQKLATELKMTIHVSHFPPGTSKWNKIEHRMFCFISQNWRGRPLIDQATVVNLIGSTKTKTGLQVQARLDENFYQTGLKVSDAEFTKILLRKDSFHGEWNYTISPTV